MPTSLPGLTAVLVLYARTADQSECFRSLQDILVSQPALAEAFTLLLYDNSPNPSPQPGFPATMIYQHDTSNGGVAAGYNAGLDLARKNGSPWLLLLDQDTALTADYFKELRGATQSVPEQAVAIVPRLAQHGKTHSPQRLPKLKHQRLPENLSGLLPRDVSAFNSGAAIRVSALQRFPVHYWLDFLDHAVFHELQAKGGRIWLMQTKLQHSLSTESLGKEASLGRYTNVLRAERDFYREYGSTRDKLFYRLRRVRQTAGHLIKVKDKRFALLDARAALGLLGPTPPRH